MGKGAYRLAARGLPVAFASCLLGLGGCPEPPWPYVPPTSPVPMSPLNTVWDDYNAGPPPAWSRFVWSTNRGSEGADFDVWQAEILFENRSEGDVVVLSGPSVLAEAQSPADEFGPTQYWYWGDTDVAGDAGLDLVFASDRSGGQGGLDLYLLQPGGTPTPLDGLNTPFHDAYLTYVRGSTPLGLLASDRAGAGTGIYRIVGTGDSEPPFGGPDVECEREGALSSTAEDTAPYLFYDTYGDPAVTALHVVFASDRAGGQGGYDVWCSRLVDGRWEEPTNLGAPVNTSSDEFRPAVATFPEILVFSSNRPGGAGGFDLYFMAWQSPYAGP